jgi:hypothetical protein
VYLALPKSPSSSGLSSPQLPAPDLKATLFSPTITMFNLPALLIAAAAAAGTTSAAPSGDLVARGSCGCDALADILADLYAAIEKIRVDLCAYCFICICRTLAEDVLCL